MKQFIIALLILISAKLPAQEIGLATTGSTLKLVTTTTADIDYTVTYYDVTSSGAGPSATSEGKITSATTTTIVSAPASSTTRVIKGIVISNIHASNTNTVTLKKDISSTQYQETNTVTLLAGESYVYGTAIGWQKYSSGGVPQQASVSFQIDVQTFTGNGTWTKPTNFTSKEVTVMAWGAGGGGGGGGSLATAVVCKGGGGGGGGVFRQRI